MERLDSHSSVGCHLPKEKAPEMARYILEMPDLTREVVLQNLNDPPIPFSETTARILGSIIFSLSRDHSTQVVPARECPAFGSA